jgi:hypothetical protein
MVGPKSVPPEVFMRKGFSLLGALALGIAASTMARPAAAQAFGNQGDIAFSAERLMGIYFHDEGESSTNIGLALAPLADSVYQLPRLGIDYFIIDNLSIGGSVGFTYRNPEHGPAQSGGLINPRVGYAIEFSKTFGFWPRGGFTYRNVADDEEFALTLEAMFYAAPVQHLAITFGPMMDLGIAGTGPEAKDFALVSGGILGWY